MILHIIKVCSSRLRTQIDGVEVLLPSQGSKEEIKITEKKNATLFIHKNLVHTRVDKSLYDIK